LLCCRFEKKFANRLQNECSESVLFGSFPTEYMSTPRTVVIKVGTDVLKDLFAFSLIARQIAELKRTGVGAILVSSGGVIAGSDYLTFIGGDPYAYQKRVLASIGARSLLNRWGEAFALDRLAVAQFYITYGNLRFRGERESIRSALRKLAFDTLVVPLVNENDIVSGVEISKMAQGLGDNDRLARIIANLVRATGIAFVTVRGGVYTANPDSDASATLLPYIDASRQFRGGRHNAGTSRNGVGGMGSKVRQASICARKGMEAGIIGPSDIIQFFDGRGVGTKVAV